MLIITFFCPSRAQIPLFLGPKIFLQILKNNNEIKVKHRRNVLRSLVSSCPVHTNIENISIDTLSKKLNV